MGRAARPKRETEKPRKPRKSAADPPIFVRAVRVGARLTGAPEWLVAVVFVLIISVSVYRLYLLLSLWLRPYLVAFGLAGREEAKAERVRDGRAFGHKEEKSQADPFMFAKAPTDDEDYSMKSRPQGSTTIKVTVPATGQLVELPMLDLIEDSDEWGTNWEKYLEKDDCQPPFHVWMSTNNVLYPYEGKCVPFNRDENCEARCYLKNKYVDKRTDDPRSASIGQLCHQICSRPGTVKDSKCHMIYTVRTAWDLENGGLVLRGRHKIWEELKVNGRWRLKSWAGNGAFDSEEKNDAKHLTNAAKHLTACPSTTKGFLKLKLFSLDTREYIQLAPVIESPDMQEIKRMIAKEYSGHLAEQVLKTLLTRVNYREDDGTETPTFVILNDWEKKWEKSLQDRITTGLIRRQLRGGQAQWKPEFKKPSIDHAGTEAPKQVAHTSSPPQKGQRDALAAILQQLGSKV